MQVFKRLAILFSFAVLVGLALNISAANEVEAGEKIRSEFDMVENLAFVIPTPGASGTGSFKLKGEDLDDLDFRLTVQAEDLLPNTFYQISITVREGTGAPTAVPIATVVAGGAWTNSHGKFTASGGGTIPNVFGGASSGDTWRIDQQVLLPGNGTAEGSTCIDCVLVCTPTTPITLNDDGELVSL